MNAPRETWAVFGGSFDPPHMGHVMAATWVANTQAVDRVLVVPAFQHAFDKRLTPFPHRRRMAELAFARLRGVTVTDLEARLGGASYTVRTLQHLRDTRPDVSLRLMIGTDLVEQVPRWRDGPLIPELAALLVVGRGRLRWPIRGRRHAGGLVHRSAAALRGWRRGGSPRAARGRGVRRAARLVRRARLRLSTTPAAGMPGP